MNKLYTLYKNKSFLRWSIGAYVLIVLVAWGAWRGGWIYWLLPWARRLVTSSLPFLGLGVVAAVFLAILWKVPQWQVRHVAGLEPKDRFDRVNEARKTLAQIIGGILLVGGFYATLKNIALTQESLSVSQEGQITDRFTKAIAQLGDSKLEVRLGGIYGLERIANESGKDHWPIVEVLTAYVRENATLQQKEQQSAKTTKVSPTHAAADIQAILTVIGRRNYKFEHSDQFVNLPRIAVGPVDLVLAHLNGANLSEADLRGANLPRADLSHADLSGANLSGADLNLAKLERANLNGAKLGGSVAFEADLTWAILSKADLGQANLGGANLTGTNLQGANLAATNLRGVNFNGTDLAGADLSGADLRISHYLFQSQINEARGDSHTELPPDLHRPATWK
jgi:uncharacterized protein YjbI with pentapeptide repeats